MKNFLGKIQKQFQSEDDPDLGAAQGTVPMILLIAGFAVVTILVVTWIGNSIAWRAHLEALCIAQAEGYETLNGSPDEKCVGLDEESEGTGIIANQVNNTKGGRF